ncbi:MAG: hypothetical protein JRC68_08885 [Deltaproteobacteria bacterium]|nr:hypothetical protein [Deltaproteobacteria bacterium]
MEISRYNKSCQIWKLENDMLLSIPIKGLSYESDYLILKKDGELQIKAEYAWNGCSPKAKIFGMVFGTPEGALPLEHEKRIISRNLDALGIGALPWDKPKTYFASLVHDCLYQISDTHPKKLDRRKVDRLFYRILRAYRFLPASLYYLFVRIFGKYFWGSKS